MYTVFLKFLRNFPWGRLLLTQSYKLGIKHKNLMVKNPNFDSSTALVTGIVSFFTLDAGLLARSQYSEGPATGHLDTGFFLGFPVSISKC